MVPGGRAARRGNGVTHVWNEPSRAVYDRTYRVLFDAGLNEELADELATQRTLAAAFRRARNYMRTSLLPHCFQANAMWKHDGASHQKGCSYQVFNGAPERIRTPDPQIRSLLLKPLRDLPGRLRLEKNAVFLGFASQVVPVRSGASRDFVPPRCPRAAKPD